MPQEPFIILPESFYPDSWIKREWYTFKVSDFETCNGNKDYAIRLLVQYLAGPIRRITLYRPRKSVQKQASVFLDTIIYVKPLKWYGFAMFVLSTLS